MDGSPGDVSEELVTWEKRKKGWRMNCDLDEVTVRLSTAHSPTFPSLHLHHSSFSIPSVALPTSQLILQPFRCFIFVTAHSSTLLSLLILKVHSPSFPSLHLRHSSFSSPSLALPTSQLILQPFRCFTYVTAHSPTLVSLFPRHKLFTYVTWRAVHDKYLTFSSHVL